MASFFSFKRVSQLIAAIWTEKRTLFSYAFLVLLGLMAFVMLYWVNYPETFYSGTGFRERTLLSCYLDGLLLLAGFSTTAFYQFNSKTGKSLWFMQPARLSEKLVAVLFWYVLVFMVVYTLCYLAFYGMVTGYIKNTIGQNPDIIYIPLNWSYRFDFMGTAQLNPDMIILRKGIYSYMGLQAFFVLGSVYFKKLSFVKTLVIAVGVYLCYTYGKNGLEQLLGVGVAMDDLRVAKSARTFYEIEPPFFSGPFQFKKIYSLVPWLDVTLRTLFYFIWAPFFYWITWIRLGETEVNS